MHSTVLLTSIVPYWNWNFMQDFCKDPSPLTSIVPYWNWNCVMDSGDGEALIPQSYQIGIEICKRTCNTLQAGFTSIVPYWNWNYIYIELDNDNKFHLNRTILELKFCYSITINTHTKTSIVPYWNWNSSTNSLNAFIILPQSYHIGIEIKFWKLDNGLAFLPQSYHIGIEINRTPK